MCVEECVIHRAARVSKFKVPSRAQAPMIVTTKNPSDAFAAQADLAERTGA